MVNLSGGSIVKVLEESRRTWSGMLEFHRSGTYEMYIYVGMFLNDWVQPLHRYTFYYDGLEESITLNINGLSAGVKSVIIM